MSGPNPIPPRITGIGDVSSDRTKAKLQTAVRDFESLFVSYMLKSMRQSMSTEEMFGDSFGGDILDGMFDTELAKQMSRNSSFGMAEMLYRKMTGEHLPAPGALTHGAKDALPVQPAGRKNSVVPQSGPDHAGASPTPPHPAKSVAAPPSPTPETPAGRKAGVASPTGELHPVSPRHVSNGLDRRLIPYESAILEAAEKHSLDPNLIKAVIASESGGNAAAQSAKNAKGLMQLIDTTAADMGVKNVWDPKENILGGSKYLQQLLQRFSGNVDSALASYNAGPGAVEKHGGVPPFKETQAYVKKVKNYIQYFTNLEGGGNDGK
ncbi:MAG: transglycosylase SLT domain-containing protein [Bacteroidota bacterium]